MTRIKLAEGVHLTNENTENFGKSGDIVEVYGMRVIEAKHFCAQCPVPNPNVPDEVNRLAYDRHVESFEASHGK